MDFQFDYSKTSKEELSLEHLRFFYYDVAKWSELSQLVELGNNELLDTASKLDIKLTPIEKIAQAKPDTNEIIFEVRNSETYQSALLRHLRNSFSHFRITYTHDNSYFLLKDKDETAYTMLGHVKYEYLKKLIFELRNYHEESITSDNLEI